MSRSGDTMLFNHSLRFSPFVFVALVAQLACQTESEGAMSPADTRAISDSISKLVVSTYDIARPNAVARLMSLYPETGPVYSASSGRVTTTRAELQAQIETFWKYVGSNMRGPKWEWTSMHVDVLSPNAATMTASYRVPHLNPMNMPHTIAGAWTAVFAKRHGRWVIVQEHLSDVPAPAEPQP